jgi:hypothetical protein
MLRLTQLSEKAGSKLASSLCAWQSNPVKVALSLPTLACTQDVKDSSWVDTARDLVPIALVEVGK